MEVKIDGVPANAWIQAPDNVRDALAAIADNLRAQRRAMIGIEVDGKAILPEDLSAELSDRNPAEIATLSVASERISALVAQCLNELEHVLPELPQACHRLAEVFQGDSPESGYEPFEQLAAIWHVIKERELQVVNALGIEEDALFVAGTPLAKTHEELNLYIEEAAGALQARDCVLLGDLLEYELAPRAETEMEIVAILREKARAWESEN